MVTSLKKMWLHSHSIKTPLLQKDLEQQIQILSTNLQPCLPKQPLKTQQEVKELEIMY